jgi:hypothetical protein
LRRGLFPDADPGLFTAVGSKILLTASRLLLGESEVGDCPFSSPRQILRDIFSSNAADLRRVGPE